MLIVRPKAFALLFAAFFLSILTLATWSSAPVSASLAGCPMFPSANIWNTPVDNLPVLPNSNAIINAMYGTTTTLHPDFGANWNGGPFGIPYTTVLGTQPMVPVTFTWWDESDAGPYPIPPTAPIEGGDYITNTGDRHVLVMDSGSCVLYEMYNAWRNPDNSWNADAGAKFDLNSNALRPAGWTSADAAGLSMLPGLVRYDEVTAGVINHAVRFTANGTNDTYVWPGRHKTLHNYNANYPAMGQRLRLKASYQIPAGYSTEAKVILTALKKYGMMMSDNGSNWYLSGAPDALWDDNALNDLKKVLGSNFEVVDASVLMFDSNSGQARQGYTRRLFIPALFR